MNVLHDLEYYHTKILQSKIESLEYQNGSFKFDVVFLFLEE